MIKDDCIFCKLANGVFPTNKIYEDEDFTVILDASPANKGHALILPKQHFDCLFKLDDEIAAKVLPLAKKIGAAIKVETKADGINIIQNNGAAAGQTVFHFHTHIVPRYDNDNVGFEWRQLTPDEDEQKELAEKLAKKLAGEN
ncbi:MAG: HIT family protein [Eubacterium sp.]|nr:HIT family protein [Eubacterium sp.]